MFSPERLTLVEMAQWADQYMASRPHDVPIGPEGNPNMLRWYLVPRNSVFNAYLHRFLRSDDDRALHDHPGDNQSWILSGECLEHLQDGTVAARRAGDVVRRRAIEAHRIELVSGPVTSLFTIGPITRDWGFYCPQGWRSHYEYTDGYGKIGRGCG